jgi:hypothetical protein
LVYFWYKSGHIGDDEMSHLIHDGVVLFVCCSIMGAVIVDFMLSDYLLKGAVIFAIYIFPLFLLGLISVDYLFIRLKIIDGSCFDPSSKTSIFVMGFSVIYSTLSKADLYIKEDSKHDNLQYHNYFSFDCSSNLFWDRHIQGVEK